MKWNNIYVESALTGLRGLPARSVRCCITSPPYYKLRDYEIGGQYGQEDTPQQYVRNLVRVFRAVKRVLTDDGTLWLNLGDTYAKKSHSGGNFKLNPKLTKAIHGKTRTVPKGCKVKDLIGIPWMVAFALRAQGWYLRQDIIWHKPNPMPESVRDRCTKSHEYIFLLSKSSRYYFNHHAVKQLLKESSHKRLRQDVSGQTGSRRVPGKMNGPMKSMVTVIGGKKHKNLEQPESKANTFHQTRNANGKQWQSADRRAHRRSVWNIPTRPSKEAHFAIFPVELPLLCIGAGSAPGDLILDPFAGTGTTLLAASMLDRRYIGFDLNPKYVAIARKRLRKFEGIFYKGP